MLQEAFVLLLAFFSVSVNCEMNIRIMKASSDKAFEDVVFQDKVLQSETVDSLTHCAGLCLKFHTCLSFFYNSGVTSCHVHAVIFNNSTDGKLEIGWKYYRVEEFLDSNPRNYCPQGWKLYNGYCYFFNRVDSKSWGDAKTYCEEQQGMLAEVFTQEEHDFITSLSDAPGEDKEGLTRPRDNVYHEQSEPKPRILKHTNEHHKKLDYIVITTLTGTGNCHHSGDMQSVWLTGLWRQPFHFTVMAVQSGGRFWLGGYDIDGSDNWVWMASGQSLEYTAWADGEPNDYHGMIETCLGNVGPPAYVWNDYPCETKLNFICEKEAL